MRCCRKEMEDNRRWWRGEKKRGRVKEKEWLRYVESEYSDSVIEGVKE